MTRPTLVYGQSVTDACIDVEATAGRAARAGRRGPAAPHGLPPRAVAGRAAAPAS